MALKPIKGHPGRFLDTSSGQVLNISEYREDDKFDTICIYGMAKELITEGKQYVFFRDIERKQKVDTNFTQPSRLSAGEQMVVDRVGTSIEAAAGDDLVDDTDFVKIAANAHFQVNVNSILLTEGPMIKYAAGYGYSGVGDTSTMSAVMNIGIPSPAAVTRLLKTQTLTEKHEIIGYLTFFDRNWADWTRGTPLELSMPEFIGPFIFVKAWLHGLLKVAVNK